MHTRNIITRATASLAVAAATLAAAIPVAAQTQPINISTTATPFLSITPDARSAGMGDLGIATHPDAFTALHNNAATPFAKDPSSAGLTYTPWLRDLVEDMYLLGAGGYHQLDENQALSAGIRYFNLGSVPISDYNGNKLQTSNPREYSLDLGYSRKLSEHLGLGLTLRYIHSNLGTGDISGTTYKAATAFATDLSIFYNGLDKTGQGLTAGAVLSNLGSRVSYSNDATAKDFLPATAGIGIAYTGVANEDNKFTLSAEAVKSLVPAPPTDSAGIANEYAMSVTKSWTKSFSNDAYTFHAGGEYNYKDIFFLRAGYTTQTQQAGNLKYFTAGVGLKYENTDIDFSYLAPSGSGITRSPLSNTFRLGLIFSFGTSHRRA